jgi:hypothetical protein
MAARERRQNRFILGAIIGGVIGYYASGNILFWAAIGAIAGGILLSRYWE